ncbi:MAG: virulence RhuM family protein [Clostridia bacterium]|nr:virulence RhuM family protein [Clostridia bacterium]
MQTRIRIEEGELILNNIENLKDLIVYQSQNNENISVEVLYNEEDFWLTQKSMAKLFNVEVNTINYHLKEIFENGELEENRTIRKIRTVQNEGSRKVTRELTFYSLDAIIAIGYRVNSKEATDFRIWATKTLKEYIKKGFVVNSEFLKNGPKFGKDYFDELLVKIKEIRASERRFYQKITDIYKECSYDYDKNSNTTQEFYKNVQNKLHYAITGMTAPEIIYNRVDSSRENMGLTTWKNAPNGKILETDVTIAKNYLSQEEITELNNLVSMYLDYAERQVKLNKIISMQEWKDKLEVFLKVNEYNILKDNGKIRREIADKLALDEYEKYRVIQDKKYISDFDELLAETKNLKNN